MRAAVALVALAAARRDRRSLVVTAVLVAIITAAVLSAAAGARRTASVLDRYLDATDAPDVEVYVNLPWLTTDADAMTTLADDLASLPGVRHAAPYVGLFAMTNHPAQDFDLLVRTGPDARYLDVSRPTTVAGRLADPARHDEVAVSERTARSLGLGIGSRVPVWTIRGETWAAVVADNAPFAFDGPTLRLRVVGVVRDVFDVDANSTTRIAYASPALFERLGADAAPMMGAVALSFDDGIDVAATMEVAAAVTAAADAAAGGVGYVSSGSIADQVAASRRATDVVAVVLGLFSGVVLVAGSLGMGQVLARQIASAASSATVLGSLGMRRSERTVALVAPLAVAITAGVVAGSGAAVGASRWFPVLAPRRLEVDPGVAVDPAVIVGGAIVLAGMLVAMTAWLARRAVDPSPSTGRDVSAISHVRLPLTAWGSAAVFDRRRRAQAASVRSMSGLAVGVAAVLALAVFASSRTAATSPDRFGVAWDATTGLPTPGELPSLLEALSDDARVDAVAVLTCRFQGLAGIVGDTPVCSHRAVAGSLAPVISAGRAPSAPAEVALAASTASALDARIGDTVQLDGPGAASMTVTVVGTYVSPIAENGPGTGALLTPEGIVRFSGRTAGPDGDVSVGADRRLLLTYAAGVDHALASSGLAADHGVEFDPFYRARPPELVSSLGQIAPILVGLAALVSLLGVLGYAHMLTISTSRARRELAVLVALGFTRPQLRAVVVWQGLRAAALAVLVGLPLGVIIGRWSWSLVVDGVGMIDPPATPLGVIVLAVSATLAITLVVTAFPAWWATHRPPGAALLAESWGTHANGPQWGR